MTSASNNTFILTKDSVPAYVLVLNHQVDAYVLRIICSLYYWIKTITKTNVLLP